MQQTTIVAALIAAVVFAVAGWYVGSRSPKVSILKHSHDAKNCRGVDCKIDIKVDCVDPSHPSPATCEPYADKAEVITIDATNRAIDFDIKTNGFDFEPTDGIKFTTLNDGDKYFACTPQGGSSKKYTCAITGATANTLYKYSIHIKGLDATDPWVVNY